MKILKKRDFKKLALLGIASGTLLASQASAETNNNINPQLIAYGCGSHGCNAGSQGGKYQAYRNTPNQSPNYYNDDQMQGTPAPAGCGSANAPQGQQAYRNTPQSGCGASHNPQGQQAYNNKPQSGCGASHNPQGQQAYNNKPQSGCGASHNPQGQQAYNYKPKAGCGAAQKQMGWNPHSSPEVYSEWETSDMGTPSDHTRPSSSYGPPQSSMTIQGQPRQMQGTYQQGQYQNQNPQGQTQQGQYQPGYTQTRPSGGYTADNARPMNPPMNPTTPPKPYDYQNRGNSNNNSNSMQNQNPNQMQNQNQNQMPNMHPVKNRG